MGPRVRVTNDEAYEVFPLLNECIASTYTVLCGSKSSGNDGESPSFYISVQTTVQGLFATPAFTALYEWNGVYTHELEMGFILESGLQPFCNEIMGHF